ncbi:SlyX family protein [Rhodocista pekingensis]|uniref:Protein SlyX homolog n=1 Tax=Rhodocista pekingensis TaxID=201185 RepID=A0ABW2KRY0_9PROT
MTDTDTPTTPSPPPQPATPDILSDAPASALAARVTELEIRLTHQDRMLEELSDVVAAQARTIDTLTLRLRLVTERLRDAESWRPSPQDEKPPPHY